jgi:hypothetical protein
MFCILTEITKFLNVFAAFSASFCLFFADYLQIKGKCYRFSASKHSKKAPKGLGIKRPYFFSLPSNPRESIGHAFFTFKLKICIVN